ncbi:putative UDP-Glycosyltransferase superfamily protein [Hibiscus syriacus]|uniref:UDP-Glycosyltransferase superfamily protein n=1 Tax=Hibiscus syriacus TaxID=106335 RepID=A0A6A3B5K0_HIBSY|nr:putative UDP-Glycosyltransferase superfamily protein [Hibiscus syriacus]
MKRDLREILLNISPTVDCIIGDGFLGFSVDVARELGIPIICFRTSSPHGFWAYYSIPDIIQAGELPIKDLPSFCRAPDMEDPIIKLFVKETRRSTRADALILNTTEELDGPILSQIRTKCPTVYAIGPINAQLNTRLKAENREPHDHFSNTPWEEDESCIPWLDKQPNRSVIYVSFGSITSMSMEKLVELWYGLINSKAKYLLVVRPNFVTGDGEGEDDVVFELLEKTKD